MARKKSVFSARGSNKETVSAKIDAELKNRIDRLQKNLQELAPNLKFDIPEIIEGALSDAVEEGEAELARLRETGSPATSKVAALAS